MAIDIPKVEITLARKKGGHASGSDDDDAPYL